MKPVHTVSAAAEVFGTSPKAVVGKRPTGEARLARMLACAAMREDDGLTFEAIGRSLGTDRMGAHRIYASWLSGPRNVPDAQRAKWRKLQLNRLREAMR